MFYIVFLFFIDKYQSSLLVLIFISLFHYYLPPFGAKLFVYFLFYHGIYIIISLMFWVGGV